MKRMIIAIGAFVLPIFANVDGTVLNRTTGKPQPGVVVTLVQPSQSGMDNLGSMKTDAEGKFHFDKGSAGGPQLVQALYSGVKYNKMIPPGTPATGVTVEVFDASTDPAIENVQNDFILFQPHDQKVVVTEVILVGNASTSTYSDPKKGAVRFYVPADGQSSISVRVTGAEGMPLDQIAKKSGEADVYLVDYPVKPGNTRFDISYTLPATQPMTVAGKFLNAGDTGLFVPTGVSLKGDNIAQAQQGPNGLLAYRVTGASFNAEISGSAPEQAPATESTGDDENGPPKVGEIQPLIYQKKFMGQPVLYWIIEIALGILALGLILLYRSEKPQPAEAGDAGQPARRRKGAVG